MTWDCIEGYWKEFKGHVRSNWGRLTLDDLDVIEGNRESLEARLRKQYGYDREQARREVDDWLHRLRPEAA
jgi:uncharacterized protein YjbJ (UPF0337 family)